MSAYNLPPGCTLRDIEENAGTFVCPQCGDHIDQGCDVEDDLCVSCAAAGLAIEESTARHLEEANALT